MRVQWVMSHYAIITPETAAVLVTGSVVLFICTLMVTGAIRDLKTGDDKQIQPDKAELYSRFLECWYDY